MRREMVTHLKIRWKHILQFAPLSAPAFLCLFLTVNWFRIHDVICVGVRSCAQDSEIQLSYTVYISQVMECGVCVSAEIHKTDVTEVSPNVPFVGGALRLQS